MKWRKWNNILHRDIGYLAVGLTLIYAISGVAVNHIDDWNPNYKIEIVNSTIIAISEDKIATNEIISDILGQLGIDAIPKNNHYVDRETLQIFLGDNTVTANLTTGDVSQEIVKRRTLIKPMNFLHLNHPKKLWTWVADLYAIALAFLAITGLFVLKGKKGITGRGAWLAAVGMSIPILFKLLYFE